VYSVIISAMTDLCLR